MIYKLHNTSDDLLLGTITLKYCSIGYEFNSNIDVYLFLFQLLIRLVKKELQPMCSRRTSENV
jgi:hypothetical protein